MTTFFEKKDFFEFLIINKLRCERKGQRKGGKKGKKGKKERMKEEM